MYLDNETAVFKNVSFVITVIIMVFSLYRAFVDHLMIA